MAQSNNSSNPHKKCSRYNGIFLWDYDAMPFYAQFTYQLCKAFVRSPDWTVFWIRRCDLHTLDQVWSIFPALGLLSLNRQKSAAWLVEGEQLQCRQYRSNLIQAYMMLAVCLMCFWWIFVCRFIEWCWWVTVFGRLIIVFVVCYLLQNVDGKFGRFLRQFLL